MGGANRVCGRGLYLGAMWLTVAVDVLMALGAYLIADGLIGSRSMRESFIKAGLSGKDLNKTSEDRV